MVSIPGGTFLQTQQSYNANNQLTSKYWKMWAQLYGDVYTYNDDGSLNTMATASGANLQYHYDHLRRVSSITSNLWGTMPFYTKTYTYKDISETQTTTQVSSVAYSNVMAPITFGYTYDTVGNVLTYSQTGEGTITYTYDNQGQLLQAAGDTTYTYTYDNVGNILTASNGSVTHTYTYADANWKDLLTKFDGVSITYDASGNPLSYYNGTNWTYTWAAGRRLMSAVGGGNTVNFSYNEDGSRASKTVNGTRHNYTWDGTTLVRDYYGNTILDFSYDASGRPYAMHYNSTPYFYILNLQGDVIRMIDGNGNTVANYEYDPYGKVISATGTLADINPIRYRGYYYDQETGLYHLWSRYYDPQTGRFISADSLASTGQGMLGYNMFAYCNNCPVNRYDLLGNSSISYRKASDEFLTGFFNLIGLGGGGAGGAILVPADVYDLVLFAVGTVGVSTLATSSKTVKEKQTKTYSVYSLVDQNGIVQYVGRVTDDGYKARMTYHLKTRGLVPGDRISGLNYAEARGLEEIGMIECHTLNPSNPINNQIHGVSQRNDSGENYMKAALDYLSNRTENFILNLFG